MHDTAQWVRQLITRAAVANSPIFKCLAYVNPVRKFTQLRKCTVQQPAYLCQTVIDIKFTVI